MLKKIFSRTQTRDDILATLGASLKRRDETTAREKLLELLQSHGQDPDIIQPVHIALTHMTSWNDPYQLLVTTGKMIEHVTDSRALATLTDRYVIHAAQQLEGSDPLYALSIYGQVFEHSPGETDHQLSCLEGILRVTENPHPADIEPMARHLVTLAESADNHDPAQLRLHNRVMDMSEQVNDPVLAMELYLAIFGNSDEGSGLERDSFNALMALSHEPDEKDRAPMIEGLYHAHEIGRNNRLQQTEIEDRLIVLADASRDRDPLTAYAAYHFLIEELPPQDGREQGLMTKMMHLSESLATRDQENVLSGLNLLQKRAGQNSSIFSRARHLHESMTARLIPATYPDLNPLSPKNFSIIHGSGITPL